jgi:hypothetical protein
MSEVMGQAPDVVSLKPPEPTAKAVRAHRCALELQRDALRAGAAKLALASARGDTGAQDALSAIYAKLGALQFEIDYNHEAHELAVQEDAAAEVAWRASIQTLDPEEIIAGIGKDSCCRRCTPGIPGGCVISGAAPHAGSTCWHPTRMGSFHQFNLDNLGKRIFPLRDNPQVSRVFDAALDKLKVRGKFA